MEFLKNMFQELLKKKDQLMQCSKLSVLLSDPFTFFFMYVNKKHALIMCIFMFVLTSIMTYLYCFCKGYETRRSPRIHKMSKKVR
ncbi:hypothetical protein PCYB_134340 [Plasmodium cynomolgi strain B]|uniref:Uncharacterized protein n=1 Tax=Plasmodium cynomolgi (strain B) TaxID=1120755 RepID=K6V0L7_PLACD|nr:hypothetical protein PCYB_134340 [Plasmodium cynomolgi strain B]GAB68560.1 hypothetical protein PCYB_134340 [Plasmodium cynomolgi strain B]